MSGFALPATQPTTLLQDAELVRFGSFHLSEYDVFDYKQHLFEENYVEGLIKRIVSMSLSQL